MTVISEVFPPIENALELEPEELAVPLIECLVGFEHSQLDRGMLCREAFTYGSQGITDYAGQHLESFGKRISEAWSWLMREGLIAPLPGTGDFVFVTRRGHKFGEDADYKKFKAASLFPSEILDPRLASKSRPAFLRGDYDSAVFEAFKEVEIRVRKLSGSDPGDLAHIPFRRLDSAFRLLVKSVQHIHRLGKTHSVDCPISIAAIIFHNLKDPGPSPFQCFALGCFPPNCASPSA